MIQPHEMFFTFTRDITYGEGEEKKTLINKNGISWDSIEWFYTDDKEVLHIVLKSQAEGWKQYYVEEKGRIQQKQMKALINSVIKIEKPEEIERFFNVVKERFKFTSTFVKQTTNQDSGE
jgi:hypothetical protein